MEIVGTQRIGSHIQKVVLGFVPNPGLQFDVGCYIQPMIADIVPRAYSVVEWTADTCTIIVSFSGMGVGARFFAMAPVGTLFDAYGPFSDFPYHYGTGRPKVFLATGTGTAPFVAMTREAVLERAPSLLVLGVPKEEDIPYRQYFDRLHIENQEFTPFYVLSRPDASWSGARGYVTDQFTGSNERWLRASDVYVCGVPMMVESSLAMLKKARVPAHRIFVQKFG